MRAHWGWSGQYLHGREWVVTNGIRCKEEWCNKSPRNSVGWFKIVMSYNVLIEMCASFNEGSKP